MTELPKRRRTWFYLWLLASLGWIGFIAWRAYERWPSIPLDMSGLDAETQKVYTEALVAHVFHASIVGLSLPLVGYIFCRVFGLIRRG